MIIEKQGNEFIIKISEEQISILWEVSTFFKDRRLTDKTIKDFFDSFEFAYFRLEWDEAQKSKAEKNES